MSASAAEVRRLQALLDSANEELLRTKDALDHAQEECQDLKRELMRLTLALRPKVGQP